MGASVIVTESWYKAHAQFVDVADDAAIVADVAETLRVISRIDTVVANAGIASQKPFIDIGADTYHALINVNQHGIVFTLREVARHMVKRGAAGDRGGSLILCGSGAVFQGVPTMTHYGDAKGALNALAKGIAAELGPHGIRCNVIAPGFILTELLCSFTSYVLACQSDRGRSSRSPGDEACYRDLRQRLLRSYLLGDERHLDPVGMVTISQVTNGASAK